MIVRLTAIAAVCLMTGSFGPASARSPNSAPATTFTLAPNVTVQLGGGEHDPATRDARGRRLAERAWEAYCDRDARLRCVDQEDYLIRVSLLETVEAYCWIQIDGVKVSDREESKGVPILDTEILRCAGNSGVPVIDVVDEAPNKRRGDIGIVD